MSTERGSRQHDQHFCDATALTSSIAYDRFPPIADNEPRRHPTGMNEIKRISLFLSLVALPGCTQDVPSRQFVCDEIPGWIDSPQPTADKQYTVVNQCLHKWSAHFAIAPGSNSEIARAAMYRCRGAVDSYKNLRSGEKNPISEQEQSVLNEDLLNSALMRVVQQRAGLCPFPSQKR